LAAISWPPYAREFSPANSLAVISNPFSPFEAYEMLKLDGGYKGAVESML